MTKNQDFSKKKKSQFVNPQIWENTISSDDHTSRRESKISSEVIRKVPTSNMASGINKAGAVLKHPQLSKIENENRKNPNSKFSSGNLYLIC